MVIAIAIIHILAAIAMILVVLLQTGRGSEIGAAFGGGASNTLFGSSGTSGFMTKMTTGVVIVFMVTSLMLAYFYSHKQYSIPSTPTGSVPSVPATPSAPVPNVPATPSQPGTK
ncbi:MAG TPA: preprotein translocase subunit SecG [Deltaproteobacteria bacterium]|nr:preprotein translocase subunit SecG [Deltaproteobacteria bacterium]